MFGLREGGVREGEGHEGGEEEQMPVGGGGEGFHDFSLAGTFAVTLGDMARQVGWAIMAL